MLKVNLIQFGQPWSRTTEQGLAEYQKRLSKVCQFSWQQDASTKELGQWLSDSKIKVLALDRKGASMTSKALATQFQAWMTQGISQVVLLMGPSPVPIDSSLALSPVQLSGEVASVLAAEQLYRAFRILNHQPYHK